MTKEQVRAWLIEYAWLDDGKDPARVDCIIAQGNWKYIDARADQYAGAQNEPGPKAFAEGAEFALSELYECHDGLHLETCPDYKGA